MTLTYEDLEKRNIRVRALRMVQSPVLVEVPVEAGGMAYACRIGRYSCINAAIGGLGGLTTIGRYCLAAVGSQIGVGGHPTDWLSTHFFQYRDYFEPASRTNGLLGAYRETEDTTVGNDVWIGTNAIIRSGVRVGDGAVIGAGSLVLEDVEPYAIVAGSPARLIRYRFAPETIERLLAVRWWEFPHAAIIDLPFNDVRRCLDLLTERLARGEIARGPLDYVQLV